MKNPLAHILVLATSVTGVFAQHRTSYAQYMFNGLLLNPAYAGSHDALNLTALYRNQWAGIEGAPKAISFTAHSPLKKQKMSVGLTVENEETGLFNHSHALAIYSYRIKLKNSHLAFGLQAGVDSRSFNRDQLRIRDTDDPLYAQQATRTTVFTAGTGLYFYAARFYAGAAVPALTGVTGSPLIQVHGGGLLPVSADLIIKPSFLVRHLENSPLYTNVSVTTYYREIFGFGAGYSHNSSWLVYADLKLNDQLSFGYAHERALGPIAGFNSGSHEVMLRYLFRYRITAINPRYF